MRSLPCSILVLALLVPVSRVAAEDLDRDAAPFGLAWGMSVTQATELGVALAETNTSDDGVTYVATKLPKVVADVGTVLVSFGYDDKIWHIEALSREFANDSYGRGVKARFDELAAILAEKYGKGEAHTHIDAGQFGKPESFVMGISTGRSWWYTNYETVALSAQLGIGSSGGSTGFWRLITENKALRVSFEKGKKAHERDAL